MSVEKSFQKMNFFLGVFPITTYLDSSNFEATSVVSYNFMFLFQKQALSDYVKNSNISSLIESLIHRGSSKFSIEQSNMARIFKKQYGQKSDMLLSVNL